LTALQKQTRHFDITIKARYVQGRPAVHLGGAVDDGATVETEPRRVNHAIR